MTKMIGLLSLGGSYRKQKKSHCESSSESALAASGSGRSRSRRSTTNTNVVSYADAENSEDGVLYEFEKLKMICTQSLCKQIVDFQKFTRGRRPV